MYRALLLFLCSASPALAHVGHVAEWAGHSHWIAGAAIAAAAALTMWGVRKPKDQEVEAEADTDTEEETA